MAEQVDSLVLEHVRYIRRTLDDTRADVTDLKLRMTNVEGTLGQVISQIGHVQTQLAGQALRMDRIDERIARILNASSAWSTPDRQ